MQAVHAACMGDARGRPAHLWDFLWSWGAATGWWRAVLITVVSAHSSRMSYASPHLGARRNKTREVGVSAPSGLRGGLPTAPCMGSTVQGQKQEPRAGGAALPY